VTLKLNQVYVQIYIREQNLAVCTVCMHTDQGDTNDLNYMEQDTEYDTDHINSCSPLLTRGDESENVYDEMYSESNSSEGTCRVC